MCVSETLQAMRLSGAVRVSPFGHRFGLARRGFVRGPAGVTQTAIVWEPAITSAEFASVMPPISAISVSASTALFRLSTSRVARQTENATQKMVCASATLASMVPHVSIESVPMTAVGTESVSKTTKASLNLLSRIVSSAVCASVCLDSMAATALRDIAPHQLKAQSAARTEFVKKIQVTVPATLAGLASPAHERIVHSAETTVGAT